jgi:hypothetical protein
VGQALKLMEYSIPTALVRVKVVSIILILVNSFQAISVIRGVRYGVFTNKKHALNTLKMAPLLRSDVMLP